MQGLTSEQSLTARRVACDAYEASLDFPEVRFVVILAEDARTKAVPAEQFQAFVTKCRQWRAHWIATGERAPTAAAESHSREDLPNVPSLDELTEGQETQSESDQANAG